MKCDQRDCGKEATARANWPGHDGPLLCCAEHLQRAQHLAQAMGWRMTVEVLDGPNELTAQQLIEYLDKSGVDAVEVILMVCHSYLRRRRLMERHE